MSSSKEELYRPLLEQIEAVIADTDDLIANLANVAAVLHIPFDQGVCGTSARTQKTVLVPDVEKFPGHIACSALSKSEIVVPLVHNGRTQLVLDIDSDELNAFDQTDQTYLELIVATIAKKNFSDAN
jgi:L-methionine (R)-S-oxide reductase